MNRGVGLMATKQEEIWEGIAQLVMEVGKSNRHSYAVAEGIMRYLHDNDVVIKVEGELPSAFNTNGDVISAVQYKKKLTDCGFFEPLIEE